MVQQIQQDVEAGNLDNVVVRDNMDEEGGEMTLADVRNLGLEQEDEYEEYEVGEEQSEATDRPVMEMSLEPSSPQKAEASGAGDPGVSYSQAEERQGLDTGTGEFAGEDVLAGQDPGPALTREHQVEAEPSMPPRTKYSDERVELSQSALSDPMTEAEGEALLQSLGSSGVTKDEEKEWRMEQVQKQAQSAGKFFMDSLAQNAGLAADPDMQQSQSADSQHNLDMIDAIADGRQVHLSQSISEEASASMSPADLTSAERASFSQAPREDVAEQRPPSINLVTNPEVSYSAPKSLNSCEWCPCIANNALARVLGGAGVFFPPEKCKVQLVLCVALALL